MRRLLERDREIGALEGVRARRLAAAVLLACPAGTPTVAMADVEHAVDVAAALERDPVYVAPARVERLPDAAVGRLRLRILRKDIGRIKIAVVPGAWAESSGGARAFANAVDAELRARGALLVVADRSAHVVTSHDHADEAAAGLRQAFAPGGALEDQLRRAVDELAGADPGPSGDLARPVGEQEAPGGPSALPDANKIVDTVNDGLRLTFLAIAFAILAPILLGMGVAWRRGRRRREEDAGILADTRAAAEAERVALGDDIVDLDAITAMPDVAPEARAAYQRALDAYERSELALARADSPRRLDAAVKLIVDGRADAARARAAAG